MIGFYALSVPSFLAHSKLITLSINPKLFNYHYQLIILGNIILGDIFLRRDGDGSPDAFSCKKI